MLGNLDRIASSAVFFMMIVILLGGAFIVRTAVSVRGNRNRDDLSLPRKTRDSKFFLFSTVGATLTSLASVYAFFLLQYQSFGWAMFTTVIAMPFGAYIGGILASKVMRNAEKSQGTETDNSSISSRSGLLTAIIRNHYGDSSATLHRIIISLNIFAIIWLEIKILTSIALVIFFQESQYFSDPVVHGLVAGVTALLIMNFVLQFGMQGVVMTDALYWPFIILSALIVCGLTFYAVIDPSVAIQKSLSLEPEIGGWTLIFFIINIFVVNSVYHCAREDLWIRIEAFSPSADEPSVTPSDNPAIRQLLPATLLAIPVWLALIATGMMVPMIIGSSPGHVSDVLVSVSSFTIFAPLVVLGLVASMLSTCDNQFFAIRRLFQYNISDDIVSTNSRGWSEKILLSAISFIIVFFCLRFA